MLPGENVSVELTQVKRSFGRAKLLKVNRPSAVRTTPKCQHFGPCGRCALQHLKYSSQLEWKRSLVQSLLDHQLGKNVVDVEPTVGLTDPWHARTKAHFVLGQIDGKLELGHFSANSKDVIAIRECPVHHEAANRAAFALRDQLQAAQLQAYDETTNSGKLKHIVVRSSRQSNQASALLVVVNDKIKGLDQIAASTIAAEPACIGVEVHENPLPGPVLMSTEATLLAGQSDLHEQVAGISFKVSPRSFFQTSPEAADRLVDMVLKAIPLTAKNVLDLYCGVGLFSLPLAKRGHHVTGVEGNPKAIEDAQATAAELQLEIDFHVAKTEQFVKHLDTETHKFDVVVMDAPRDGTPDWVLKIISHRIRPKSIVHVSCEPRKMAEELGLFMELGYQVRSVQPLDMFPQTSQVETVSVLLRT